MNEEPPKFYQLMDGDPFTMEEAEERIGAFFAHQRRVGEIFNRMLFEKSQEDAEFEAILDRTRPSRRKRLPASLHAWRGIQ